MQKKKKKVRKKKKNSPVMSDRAANCFFFFFFFFFRLQQHSHICSHIKPPTSLTVLPVSMVRAPVAAMDSRDAKSQTAALPDSRDE
ncbi:hypothetical protein Q5P01_008580 [Channa striata]|uniref:Uncharacterized protein n=1 Tax=Channa striata TaxID=64152 RepID=A0AA88SRR8_CHASR|nr:hypothetical protein Q5P01_008580 [Channa striata]